MHIEKLSRIATPAKSFDGFQNLAAGLGVNIGNLLSQGTYSKKYISQDRLKLEAAYRESWIVGQIIDAVAEDMIRAGITINSNDAPDRITTLQTELTRRGIWRGLTDLEKWARLYGGAIAVLVIDGQKNETPLNINTVGKGQFSGLAVFDRWQLQPSMESFITSGPEMGKPMYYRIVGGQNTSIDGFLIHHSRVVRQIGMPLPFQDALNEQLWGASVLERVFDRLIPFDAATLGAANLVQRAYLRTVKVQGLRDILAMGGELEANLIKMLQYVKLLQNSEGLTILDKDDDFATNTYTFSGLPEVMIQFAQQLSGASGIPLTRLFGQAPAGLNATGESDTRNYYDRINSKQESDLRPGLQLILEVLYKSTFGVVAPADFSFKFASLWQTSTTEKVANAKGIAEAVGVAYNDGIIDLGCALKELKQASAETGIFSNITAEMIAEAEAEPPEPKETDPIPPAEGPVLPAGGANGKGGEVAQEQAGNA